MRVGQIFNAIFVTLENKCKKKLFLLLLTCVQVSEIHPATGQQLLHDEINKIVIFSNKESSLWAN